jgi:glycosyltransferase involved in cell wall biosynthesis
MRFGLKAVLTSASLPLETHERWAEVVITNGLLGGIRPLRTPTIHVFHGTMVGSSLACRALVPRRETARAALGGGMAEWLAARRAINVAVSDSAAVEARRYYRVRVDRVIPNGVDVGRFRRRDDRDLLRMRLGLEPDRKYALFVGRAEPRKGPELAAAACRAAGFELIVAGDRPVAGGRHLGVVGQLVLAELYNASDAVIFPTRYEACSYVLLEGLASEVPVVTTEVGWAADLVRHVPAYRKLIAEPAAGAFASCLKSIGEQGNDAVSVATASAAAFVRAHNSIEQFSAAWLGLVKEAQDRSTLFERR